MNGSESWSPTIRGFHGQDFHVPVGKINPVVKGEVFADKGVELSSIRIGNLEFTDQVGRLFQS